MGFVDTSVPTSYSHEGNGSSSMDACMGDGYTPFEPSSSTFPTESNDSVQAESFCPHMDSPTCSTAQHGHPEPVPDAAAAKPDQGQQNLQIDCRASQPLYYHSPMHQDYHGGRQPGASTPQDFRQHTGEVPQEPTTSYESVRLPEYQRSPNVRPASADKAKGATVQKCSQCGATKTPMWRNDTQGNKTLCNACGVRLQRQLNKQKQQTQAAQPQPSTLIAGKLPRCRTSPAKLSRQELLGSTSHDSLVGGFEPASLNPRAPGGARSLTLVHAQGGQPHLTIAQNPPKRKGSEGASRNLGPREERKRACNERGSDSGGTSNSPEVAAPDVVGPITLMAPDKMASNCFAKLHLPASSGHGGTGGMLMVYNEGCNAIAKCSQPGPEVAMRYSPEQQAWVWDGHAHCSMLLHTQEAKQQFEELLSKWRQFRQMGFNQGMAMNHMATSLPQLDPGYMNLPQGGGMFSGRQADAEDLRFLDHINLKIRGEAGGSGPPAVHPNPKALDTPLAEEIFVRLISAFEFFLQRPQGFTESNVCQLSVNLDWTPNRAVILAVHRYWMGKLHRQGRKDEYQKAMKGGGHPASIPRSFSASPPVGSGHSDKSAMTLEDFALSQQRAASEETSENTQLQSAFAMEGANLPSLDYSNPINYALPQMVQDAAGVGPFMAGRHSWVLPSCFPPDLAPYPSQQEEWEEVDPLDPATLARIADPNQSLTFETRKSATLTAVPMEDRNLQTQGRCMSLQELGSVNRGLGVLKGTPLPEDGQQMFNFLDAPGLLQPSPGDSPTARQGLRGAGRHSGVDLSSLRKQLYSGSFDEHTRVETMTHQDMGGTRNDNLFFNNSEECNL